ncbi:MAG: alpha-amylase [Labilithrix sp.]|nr:alpha-amylase [Labilithrix sp.]
MSTWWQRGVVYQIYPRSFQDTNGDGIGDLEGIRQRLDHLVTLGVDALWISPIFPSPMADFGYDVADYCDVDPCFGTLADLDALVADAHARGLRVLLDFVPNHTSSEHPWFRESRSSRDNPRRDFYIWRDPAPGGGPPNNWKSDFGGSSWEWDELTGQYYLHAFLKEQPDLDWRNPRVREAMYDVLRFWLARGIDGFRIDVLWHLIKAEGLPDNPPNPDYAKGMGEMHSVIQLHSADQPEVHAIAGEMRRIADSFGERVLIGEIYLPVERLVRYYGVGVPGVHLPFNFQLVEQRWDARGLEAMIVAYEAALPAGAWPNWVLGNHDRPRVASRLGERQARVAAMLLLTLRGTPTLYYGDELGMTDVAIPPERVVDPRELREPGLGLGRDPVRSPMAWTPSPGAGFTTGEPWLPLHADAATRNVASCAADPASMLTLHRALLALRRARPALAVGSFAMIDGHGAADVLAYERRHEGERLRVVLNLSGEVRTLALPGGNVRVLLSTRPERTELLLAGADLVLAPDEGLVLEDAP